MEHFTDYYETLHIASDSTASQIKKAYRKLCKIHHPDKKLGQQQQEACPRESVAYDFKRLQEAYEVLSCEENRASYDTAYTLFADEKERIAKEAAKERAKMEAERAKERATMEEKRAKDERRRVRRAKKEADKAAQEQKELEETEALSEQLFVQQLYNDFGEAGDAPVFQMHTVTYNASPSQERSDLVDSKENENPEGPPEAEAPSGKEEAKRLSDSNLKTPSEYVSKDPRLSDLDEHAGYHPQKSAAPAEDPRFSEDRSDSVGNLAADMANARFSDPNLDDDFKPISKAAVTECFGDPDI